MSLRHHLGVSSLQFHSDECDSGGGGKKKDISPPTSRFFDRANGKARKGPGARNPVSSAGGGWMSKNKTDKEIAKSQKMALEEKRRKQRVANRKWKTKKLKGEGMIGGERAKRVNHFLTFRVFCCPLVDKILFFYGHILMNYPFLSLSLSRARAQRSTAERTSMIWKTVS